MVGEETEKKVDVIDREIRAIHDAIKILKDKKSKLVEIEGGISLHEDYLDPNVEELRVIFISPEDLERTKLFLGDSIGVIFKITIEKTKLVDSEQNI